MEEKIDILVVGNGFDLALGYKTRYTDFLDFMLVFEGKDEDRLLLKIIATVHTNVILILNNKFQLGLQMYDSKEELGEFFYQEILSYLIEETKQVQESQVVSFFKNQFDDIFFDTVNKKQLAIKTIDYLQELMVARGNEVLQSDVEKKILSDIETVMQELLENDVLNLKDEYLEYLKKIYNFSSKYRSNAIVSYFINCHLGNKGKIGPNWVDFEEEIFRVIHNGTDEEKVIFENNRDEFNEFKKCFTEYLMYVTDDRTVGNQNQLPSLIKNSNISEVITFNYTKSYKNVIKYNNLQHIHGEIDKYKTNIVLGVDNIEYGNDSILGLSKSLYLTKTAQSIPYKDYARIEELDFTRITNRCIFSQQEYMPDEQNNVDGEMLMEFPGEYKEYEIYKKDISYFHNEQKKAKELMKVDYKISFCKRLVIVFYGFSFGYADKSKVIQILYPFFEFPEYLAEGSKIVIYAYNYNAAEDIWINIEKIFKSENKRIRREYFEIIIPDVFDAVEEKEYVWLRNENVIYN